MDFEFVKPCPDTPASFGLGCLRRRSLRSQTPRSLAAARTGAVVGATRPIAGRLAALGKTGSLRSLHLHTVGADRKGDHGQLWGGSAATRSIAGEARAPRDRPSWPWRPRRSEPTRAKPARPAIGPMAVA